MVSLKNLAVSLERSKTDVLVKNQTKDKHSDKTSLHKCSLNFFFSLCGNFLQIFVLPFYVSTICTRRGPSVTSITRGEVPTPPDSTLSVTRTSSDQSRSGRSSSRTDLVFEKRKDDVSTSKFPEKTNLLIHSSFR